ncbi:MAG: L-serine ammonia-lyase [Ignavibacteria bacterium]|jgi:L-serine dehydratase|nr:L-serine ammonia-lyase [Ignavibacteria bacterium]MCU7521701.1 L-serine ammonia-lyase [Ignavibacteria bacterium]MCU7525384.1 L-serine ammonia-lyase [Ignavibacteria bacterium]
MESIKEIYKIGFGPSSSHTIGPRAAAETFRKMSPDALRYRATLYGSLAATGKGHMTDKAIIESLYPFETEVVWKPDEFLKKHPNAMKLEALDMNGNITNEWTVYSVGGGKIVDDDHDEEMHSLYDLSTMDDILKWTKSKGGSLWEYVEETEGSEIYEHLSDVWAVMNESISRGIENEGILPGGLNLRRKASSYFVKAKNYTGSLKEMTLIFSYALAVAEENAAGGKIVTAPTCGSCGVVPAVLKRLQESFDFSEQKILRALATAGLVGNIVKTNASISGAKVGCQGEIGTACAMAAAAATQLLGGTPHQVEYAAEMGIEHHLGLTCDPICGLVQVPCIERNAFACERALNTATFALLSDGRHIVSFDKIVKTMNQTGHDLPHIYKETSEGGLALLWE